MRLFCLEKECLNISNKNSLNKYILSHIDFDIKIKVRTLNWMHLINVLKITYFFNDSINLNKVN